MRERFSAAAPFPHIVIDDFLIDAARAALGSFPADDWPHWQVFLDEYQKEKRVCADIRSIPEGLSGLIDDCSRPSVLKMIEGITSVEQLVPDPYLDGGGLHCSGAGGVLAPHTDFHVYQRLNLYRKLNLLIYLNEDWGPEDGGFLELYRKGETSPTVTIAPTFGRAVIFLTDDQSVHGFTVPVAAGKRRKSVALYYYNSRESGAFAGDTTTRWQTRAPTLRGIRLRVFEALIFGSRALSKLARTIDPNAKADRSTL